MASNDDPVVANPTWFGQIRDFFTSTDIAHMQAKGIDLSVYDVVATSCWDIYGQTSSGSMPPDPLPKWSANKNQTFFNWANQNCPKGTPSPAAPEAMFAAQAGAARVRKDVADLSDAEIATLKTAFEGMMGRDPSQPDSYFTIAGYHWFPAIDINPRFHCLHHENRFLPWHRFHLLRLEDALRSVPGCADVTLPYWDISSLEVPSLFSQPPFDKYVAQANIGHGYDPLTTSRFDAGTIIDQFRATRIPEATQDALRLPKWEDFNRAYWGVHDNGHNSIGATMRNQDISSFDPIFWFFHCNLDRVWLQWQASLHATTLSGFKSTCTGPTVWLDNAQVGALPPFTGTAADAVTLSEVAYAPPAREAAAMDFVNRAGNVRAAATFRIDSNAPLSVRVKDIDRTAIPGTFVVHLLADGEEVAQQAFFQPTDPTACLNCSENAQVPIDFLVPAERILNKDLSIEIHVPDQEDIGSQFPLSKVGSPTINVRHLLEGD
ncbi:MAG: tyrosinase family protein [Allosphingosinicella sp.]